MSLRRWWPWLAVLAGACALSIAQRQDRNWDLQNYHLYAAFAWLDGRLDQDLYAAGPQSYFNPLLDVPYYLAAMRLFPAAPRLVAALAGVPFALLCIVAWALCREVARACARNAAWTPIATAAIGLSGTTIYGEIGTTFGDMPVAVLVLAALLLACRTAGRADGLAWRASAGAVLGAACGLKLTACVYAPALVAAVALTTPGWRARAGASLAIALGWALGVAATLGWWAVGIWQRFGNPVFPYFSDLFPGRFPQMGVGADTRFLPRSPLEALFYPFHWLAGRAFVVSEGNVRDARFALAYLALAALAVAALLWRAAPRLPAPARLICIFLVLGFAVWEALFSILRYALPLEALTGVPVLLVLSRLPARRLKVALPGVLVLLVATANYSGGSRMRRYGPTVFDIAPVAVAPGAVVLIADHPIAFLAPFVRGPDVAFIGLPGVPPDSGLGQEMRARIAAAASRYALLNLLRPAGAERLAAFGLAADACTPMDNAFQTDLALCTLRDAAP
jgi:hypothetical protein